MTRRIAVLTSLLKIRGQTFSQSSILSVTSVSGTFSKSADVRNSALAETEQKHPVTCKAYFPGYVRVTLFLQNCDFGRREHD